MLLLKDVLTSCSQGKRELSGRDMSGFTEISAQARTDFTKTTV